MSCSFSLLFLISWYLVCIPPFAVCLVLLWSCLSSLFRCFLHFLINTFILTNWYINSCNFSMLIVYCWIVIVEIICSVLAEQAAQYHPLWSVIASDCYVAEHRTFLKLTAMCSFFRNIPNIHIHEKRPNPEGWCGAELQVTIEGNWTTYRVSAILEIV